MRSRARHRRRAAGGLGSGGPGPGILIPLRGEPGKAVSAVPQVPAHRWWRAVVAVPVVPARPTREREWQEEGHRRAVRPYVAHVLTPWVRARPRPAVGVDRVPGGHQVPDFEVDVRPG